MAMTTSFMGLRIWNQILDDYDHDQLADNFAKIDNHDHTPGRGVQLTTQSIAPNSIAENQLINESVSESKLVKSLSERLLGEGRVTESDLASNLQLQKSIISTEQSRENTAYGTLATPDEISLTLPANGLLMIGYLATWASSVSEAGKALIYLGSNQINTINGGTLSSAAKTKGTTFHALTTCPESPAIGSPNNYLETGSVEEPAVVTTGQIAYYGVVPIFAAAGTYTVSVRFAASSGNVKVKNRKLWGWVA